MKLLLDSCVWGGAAAVLQGAGHDVLSAAQWDHDPGDAEILAAAFAQRRVLITLDKDFGELAILLGAAHCGIIRLAGFSATEQANTVLSIVKAHESELERGALVTAEPGRLRLRLES